MVAPTKKISDEEILAELFRVHRLIRSRISGSQNHYSLLRLKILYFVFTGSNPSMKRIADCFGIAPPSATTLIKRLVTMGLIKRAVKVSDRRTIRLAITPKGRIAIKSIKVHVIKQSQIIFKNLSVRERAVFIQILKKLTVV